MSMTRMISVFNQNSVVTGKSFLNSHELVNYIVTIIASYLLLIDLVW